MMKTAVRTTLQRASLLIIAGGALTALFPSPAAAIPAWGRKYDVGCQTCHYPAPPRLNAYGHKFRRAQFRMADEFNKAPDIKSVGNYVAMRVRARYEFDDKEDGFPGGDTVTSGFKLNDATFFYAGPIAKNFSGFVELERPGDAPEVEATVSIGGIRGKPDSFWTFRLGQFHTLTRVGFGGLDRPTGISTANALSRALVSGNDFKLNQDQVGIEGTYVNKNHRVIGQILNGSSIDGAGTTDQADENRDKDYVLAYEFMWGDTASGLTAFVYDGTQIDPDISTAPGEISMSRYGVSAAQVWKGGFEVQGGFVVAKDDYKIDVGGVGSIDGKGYWVEVAKYWSKQHDFTLFGRYDVTDPDTDIDDNTRTQGTLGFVVPVADWHVRWALEYRTIKQEDTGTGDSFNEQQVVAEMMVNF
jgi:hypothetical protein